jgi:hypothetical protein
MQPQEQKFVAYWSKERKKWNWKRHTSTTFMRIVLPATIVIDLVNYFIIGDTEYSFLSFTHLFFVLRNLILLSVLVILGSGLFHWNYNENKYWTILRKYTNKLQ